MSAATAFPPYPAPTSFPSAALAETPHSPHAAHPIPLREQAFTLHCQGLRSPAIARELAVPERTVRSWIAAALDELKDDHAFSRREQLLIAVERQHALTVAAWQQFEAETAARTALLDAVLAAASLVSIPPADAAPDSTPAAPPPRAARIPRLPASTPAPRYLSLILQAHKETNRLLGLYTLARLESLPDAEPAASSASPTPVPDAPATPTASASPSPASAPASAAESATGPAAMDIPAISATAAAKPESAAESATATTSTEHAAESATGPAALAIPARSATTASAPSSSAHLIPATSATAAAGSHLAAKSATTPASRPAIPTYLRSHLPSQVYCRWPCRQRGVGPAWVV